MISLIVAAAENGVIGRDGRIPWHLPGDLPRFKQLTMGHPIIMGRKTYESIGQPLPGRYNIIVTRDGRYRARGAVVAHSIEEALQKARQADGGDEVFVIGGSQIYEAAMPLADRLYLTKVRAEVAGDAYFRYQKGEWKEIEHEEHQPDEKNPYAYAFCVLERIR